jgi:hypothetical protein
MSEATLRIVRARQCTCAKCAPKPKAAPTYTLADYAKAIAALVSEGKWEAPWAPDPPDLNALIREKAKPETNDEVAARLQRVARQQLTEMGVPLAPDLNAAIREHRAKEKK